MNLALTTEQAKYLNEKEREAAALRRTDFENIEKTLRFLRGDTSACGCGRIACHGRCFRESNMTALEADLRTFKERWIEK